MDLMWFLFLAHLTGDYALQSDRIAAEKGQSTATLTWHVAIYVACVGLTLWLYSLFTARYNFINSPALLSLVPLFGLHWVQDFVKSRYFGQSKQAYYVDQVIHLVQLYVVRLLLP